MLMAIGLFIVGIPFYKPEPVRSHDNVIVQTCGCIGRAAWRRLCVALSSSTRSKEATLANKRRTRRHWLDYADDKYSAQLIHDVKSFLRILLVFVPLPL